MSFRLSDLFQLHGLNTKSTLSIAFGIFVVSKSELNQVIFSELF